VPDDRAPADLDEGLGPLVGLFGKACAESSGKYYDVQCSAPGMGLPEMDGSGKCIGTAKPEVDCDAPTPGRSGEG